MSFEQNNTNNAEAENISSEPKKKWSSILMIFLIIALLVTWSYIIWDKSQTRDAFKLKETQYSVALSEKDTLQNLLDEVTMRYDILKTTNIKKDSLISAKDKEIAEKKSRIQFLLSKAKASKDELAEAKRLIASLNTDLEGYRMQIETLKNEKNKLVQEKQLITKERDQAQKDFDSVNTVVKNKDDIIDIGSTLHASLFSIDGINEKKNGREKETTTAKRVDKFRITFLIDENKLTTSGVKNLFILITKPDGKLVTEDDLGSGKFATRDGEEKVYTKRIDINYNQGQRQFVSFDWKQYGDFMVGDYKIEVYNNGFKIGEGIRSLKKGGLFN